MNRSESIVTYEKESVLQNIGEYVLLPQNLGNNMDTNEHQTPESPKPSHPQLIRGFCNSSFKLPRLGNGQTGIELGEQGCKKYYL